MVVHASGIILFRRSESGPRLLLLRDARSGRWGFCKGRRDARDGDDDLATARREVAEETGYAAVRLLNGYVERVEYEVRDDGEDRYRKRVTYFLGEAPPREPRLSDEHVEFHWAAPDELEQRLEFGQLRDLARRALDAIDGS